MQLQLQLEAMSYMTTAVSQQELELFLINKLCVGSLIKRIHNMYKS